MAVETVGWDGRKRVANVALDRCDPFLQNTSEDRAQVMQRGGVIPANIRSFGLMTLEVGDNEKMGIHDCPSI